MEEIIRSAIASILGRRVYGKLGVTTGRVDNQG